MNLTENEKGMVCQVESTYQTAILNEIAMCGRYARKQETKDTAESLLSKLRQKCSFFGKIWPPYHPDASQGKPMSGGLSVDCGRKKQDFRLHS